MSEQDTTQFHQVRDWGNLRSNMYFFDVNISIHSGKPTFNSDPNTDVTVLTAVIIATTKSKRTKIMSNIKDAILLRATLAR